ncbi:MAG: hypothetical protein WC310_02740 [Patescibacteria group bacterium]
MKKPRKEKPINKKVGPEEKVRDLLIKFLQTDKKGDENWLMHEIDRICRVKKCQHLALPEVRCVINHFRKKKITLFEAAEMIVI